MNKKVNKKIEITELKLISSILESHKEVVITYKIGNEIQHYCAFVEKDKKDYIAEAKKQFNEDVKKGAITKKSKSASLKNPLAIGALSIVGALALTMTGLFIWKALTPISTGEGDPNKPLTFVCNQDNGSIYLIYICTQGDIPERNIDLEYQIDSEKTWHTVEGIHQEHPEEWSASYSITIATGLKKGQEVRLRGDNEYWSYIPYDEEAGLDWDYEEFLFFVTDGFFSVENNVMSLLHKTNFANTTNINGAGCFAYLFSPNYLNYLEQAPVEETNIYDASKLILPETDVLPAYCYESMFADATNLMRAPRKIITKTIGYSACNSMFSGCTSLGEGPKQVGFEGGTVDLCGCAYMFSGCKNLLVAPELPATTLLSSNLNGCYEHMFNGCIDLVVAPPQIGGKNGTVEPYACSYMFSECKRLIVAPELPATTLGEHCYEYMFQNCTSLKVAPSKIGNENSTIGDWACYSMFNSCEKLETAPELPTTILSDRCYLEMFRNCTSLKVAPSKIGNENSTIGAYSCGFMFEGCASLEIAPELPAAQNNLGVCSYAYMFNSCKKLSYLKVGFSEWPAPQTTDLWLYDAGKDATEPHFYWGGSSSDITERSGSTVPDNWLIN